MREAAPSVKPARLPLVDVLRGIAMIGVIFYHFVWDLRFFEFHSVNVDVELGWLFFARTLLASFLLLSGFSLVLAHYNGIRWKAYWRRLGVLVAAALVVTIGTWFVFPEAFVFFGVLHAIALFSLFALPFLRLHFLLTLTTAVIVLAIGFTFRHDAFNVWYLSWIGFWTVPPLTQDLVPIFPSFGFTLIGVGLARFMLDFGLDKKIADFTANDTVSRFFALAGRWSLIIYLVHQPLLIGLLYPAAALFEPGQERLVIDFVNSCQQSCEIGAGEAGFCTRYCSCSLEQVEKNDLWPAISSEIMTPEQSTAVSDIARLCSAMAAED